MSLTHEGSKLITTAVLDTLSGFQARQIATYGNSAIPIVAACVALSAGQYTGLTIRKAAKTYGSGRRIDGPIDHTAPVVVVDESISSGHALRSAISALEAEGLQVEGAVCLVDFSGYGATEWIRASGYRVETIFDVWRDLERSTAPLQCGPHHLDPQWADEPVADGLSPAEVVRQVASAFRESGRLLLPPQRFDRAYDAGGGTYVSVRLRASGLRLVRDGFRQVSAEAADPRRDVILAAWTALRSTAVQAVQDLDSLKFAFRSWDSRINPASAHRPRAL